MMLLRYTLISDGPSDRALLPIITWAIEESLPGVPIQPEFADFRRLREPPRDLPDRIRKAIDLYPCDLLFVHRDAENEPARKRISEVEEAVNNSTDIHVPAIPMVTVRMQEAWLLFNEAAIRRAAGNPNGKSVIELPPINRLETIPDPKVILNNVLQIASGLKGRRLRSFRTAECAGRVANFIDDFSPLRQLRAFQEFESRLKQALDDLVTKRRAIES